MNETTVVNIRSIDKVDSRNVYIGREGSKERRLMHFGNPFRHSPSSKASVLVQDRETAVNEFREWIIGRAWPLVEPERRQWILRNLEMLRGKRLVCHCKPKLCHGDVYLELLHQV